MGQADPLSGAARAPELARMRPKRGLPIAPDAPPGARALPLASESRDVDRRHRPIYAVWEITLACDLACRERSEALRCKRSRTTRDLRGYCKGCYYAEECMSGCTWTSCVALGKAGNNPYCDHRSIEMARVGKRGRIVRVEQAPGQPFDHGVFQIVVEDRPPPPAATTPSGDHP